MSLLFAALLLELVPIDGNEQPQSIARKCSVSEIIKSSKVSTEPVNGHFPVVEIPFESTNTFTLRGALKITGPCARDIVGFQYSTLKTASGEFVKLGDGSSDDIGLVPAKPDAAEMFKYGRTTFTAGERFIVGQFRYSLIDVRAVNTAKGMLLVSLLRDEDNPPGSAIAVRRPGTSNWEMVGRTRTEWSGMLGMYMRFHLPCENLSTISHESDATYINLYNWCWE